MAHRDSGGRKILLHLGLFLSVVSLCHCASLREGKAPDQSEDKLNISQSGDKVTYPQNGRLLIGKNPLQDVELNHTKATEDFLDTEADYQADIGWEEDLIRHDGQKADMAAVEHLLKLEPKVECTVDSMKLQVQDAASAPAALFFVDRGHRLSPLPLSKLPPSCGYTIRSTQKDLVLVAPYDGCFVALEGDSYVLPLRWWGLPLRMSCPLMRQLSSSPPMVTCHAEGMVVKTEWTIAVSRIQVNLNEKWEPLIKVSKRCRFSIVEHPEGVVIAINYAPCLEKRDGFFTVELAGDGESKITCPALQAAQPEYPKNHTAFQHRSVLVRDPPQTAAMPSATQVPGFHLSSEMLNGKPSQDVDQSQLSYYLFHPSYMRSHPPSPNGMPTEQPLKPMPTPSPGIQSQDQRWSTHYHAPFYPQPPLPEISPTQSPMIQQQPGNLNPHFPPQSFLQPPFLPQKHVEPPARPPGNQEQKPFYPYLAFTQQPRFEAVHVDFATPHSSPPEKLPDKPRLVRRPHPEKPHRQGATTVEDPRSHVQQQHHSLHPQTKLGIQPTRKPAVVVQAPQSEMVRNQHRRFYHYPYHLYPKPGVQPAKRPFGVFQPHAAQHRHKPFYAPPKPEMEPVYKPQQPETPQGPVHPPLYNEQRPEAQSSENPAAGYRSQLVSDQEVPLGQVHQPMHLYPQLAHYSQLLGAPQPGTQTLEEADEHCDQSTMTANPDERSGQSADTPIHKPPQVQMHHPFRYFYYPWNAQHAQPGVFPQGTSVDERATAETGQQSPNPPPTTVKQCPQLCPSELPSCCPQISFHHHLHHIVAVGLGSKDTPIIYLGLPFLSSTVSSELGDVLSFVPFTQKPTEATTTQSTTTPSSEHVPLQSFPPVNAEQTYLPPPDGNPSVPHGSNPSKTADFQKPVYVAPNSLYPQWPYLSQNEGPHTLAQSQTPAHYDLPSETRAAVNEPENPAAQYGPHNTRSSEQQNSQLSAGNTNGPPRPNFMPFIGQVSQQQERKATATERSFNMDPSDFKGSTHYERGRELDRFLVPYRMLQDAPVLPHNKIVSLNNSQLQSFLSGSKNFTKHEQTPNAFSEPSFYALPLHGALSGNLIDNNGSLYDVYSIAVNLAKQYNSQPQSPDDPNYLQAKQPEWLGEEMSNLTPGSVFVIPRLYSESNSPLPPTALDGLHVLFLPFDPSVKDDLSLHDLWKSAMPLEADPNIPPHVPGKMFHRRSSATDRKTNGFQEPPRTKPDDEKHR